MSSLYIQYPPEGVPVYPSVATFPASSYPGALAVAQDTGDLYEFFDGSWEIIAGPTFSAGVTSVGLADSSTTPIFSISGSPVTSTGTLTETLIPQAAHTVFSGPTSGSAAEPTFRLLVTSDIPNLSGLYVTQSEVGAASGVASLDGSGKVPVSQLPSVVMEYQGAWNPNTNTPTLSDGTGTNGNVYYVSAARLTAVAGLTDPSMVNFQIGDLTIYSSAIGKWQLTTPAAGVSSVNGAQGAVIVNAINQLTGDVTTAAASQSQSEAATIAAIQGTTVSGTTGTGNVVFSASPTLTGTLAAASQTLSGTLVATGAISGSNITAGGHAALDVATSSLGNLTDVGTDGITVTGGTGAVVGSVSLSQHVADTTHNGYLSSTDWNTFNSKGSGTVTSISVATANGLAGTSSGGTTPALTLSTTVNAPVLAGNGTAILAATTTGTGSTVVLSAAPTLTGLLSAGSASFSSTISASNFSGSSSGTNTGDVTLGTANGLSILGQVLSLGLSSTSTTGALSSTDWNTFNGKQAAGNYITALTGDGTATGPGSVAFTLATVNTNVGSFGSSTSIPSFTVNAKGLITAASGNAVIAPAGTLSGTTLNSTVVTSSLTSVGTITSGTWNGTTIAIANGGTGQTTAANAFIALSPLTTAGDIIYENVTPTPARLPIGSTGQVLTVVGGLPSWQPASSSPALTNNHIFVGNASNVATDVAMSGDVSIVASGATTIQSIQGTTVSGTTGTGNVVFSTSPTLVTPILGAATSTSLTSPLIIGGTTASSTLTLESTSGAGTTDFINFKTGSQVEKMRLDNVGNLLLGTTNNDPFSRGYGKNLVIGGTSAGGNALTINAPTGSAAFVDLGVNGTRIAALSATTSEVDLLSLTSVPMMIGTNGITAITISTAQNVTFAGTVTPTGGIVGVATSGLATAGNVGEFISANPGSPVTPSSSNAYVNITSISLTAGDWDVEGFASLQTGGAAVITGYFTGVSLSSGTLDLSSLGGVNGGSNALTAGSPYTFPTGARRISLSTTTTVYLVGELTYSALSTTTWTVSSFLRARRMR